LHLQGSSVLSTFYSLQGLSNTVQIFALILSTLGKNHRGGALHFRLINSYSPSGGSTSRRQMAEAVPGHHVRSRIVSFKSVLNFRLRPNILALNFASTLGQSLIFLLIFMAICSVMLHYFYRLTSHHNHYNAIEGLQQPEPASKQWGLVMVSFLLTVIYLPLSTMAVHVIVWSQDLWVVPNPYLNATTSPPSVPPLGPSDEFRDPLDFCWTTTMKKNEINFAPVVIILSAVVFLSVRPVAKLVILSLLIQLHS
jgi:hypothetical protein